MAQQRRADHCPSGGSDGCTDGHCARVYTATSTKRATGLHTTTSDADLHAASGDGFTVCATDDALVACANLRRWHI